VTLSTPSFQPAYGLALHTSSPDLGLAVSNFAGDSRQQVWPLGRDVSNLMHEKLAEFLWPQTWSDLAWLAVAIGPGGFTGTRIGVVAARTLAQQLEIPLFGISSLAAIAQAQAAGTIAIQMPVQRGELATAIYQKSATGLTSLLPDGIMTPETWQQTQPEFSYDLSYHVVAAATQGDYVSALLDLAHHAWNQGQRPHWSDVVPFYGQHPVAG
jgi:tRNA threonylcarbamoyl adenosine modification protein YeaZ